MMIKKDINNIIFLRLLFTRLTSMYKITEKYVHIHIAIFSFFCILNLKKILNILNYSYK